MDPSPKEKPVNFFNTNIVGRHDDIMTLNAWMADTFNILLQAPWLSDDERDFLHDEMLSIHQYIHSRKQPLQLVEGFIDGVDLHDQTKNLILDQFYQVLEEVVGLPQ